MTSKVGSVISDEMAGYHPQRGAVLKSPGAGPFGGKMKIARLKSHTCSHGFGEPDHRKEHEP